MPPKKTGIHVSSLSFSFIMGLLYLFVVHGSLYSGLYVGVRAIHKISRTLPENTLTFPSICSTGDVAASADVVV